MVARCCEPSYSAQPLKEKGISVIVSHTVRVQCTCTLYMLMYRSTCTCTLYTCMLMYRSTCTCTLYNYVNVHVNVHISAGTIIL